MNRKKNIMLYIISALLISGYLFVGYLTLNPKVSTEYMLYYIEKKITDWPGNGGLEITNYNNKNMYFGTSYKREEQCKMEGKGWISEDENTLWTDKVGEIYFGNSEADIKVELELVYLGNKENLEGEIYINDEVVNKFNVYSDEIKKVDIFLTNEHLNEDYNVISLALNKEISDESKLGIKSIKFQTIE